MATRVAFRFPRDTEIRYVDGMPKRGEEVRSARGEIFVVARAEDDGIGAVATCVEPREFLHESRQIARSMRRGAAETRDRRRVLEDRALALRSRLSGRP